MGAKEKGLKADPETEGQESGSKRGKPEVKLKKQRAGELSARARRSLTFN